MADELIPSRSQPLPTDGTPGVPGGVVAPGRTAITTGRDGALGKPNRDADKEAPPLHIPWSSWLLNLGAQFAFGLLLAVFLLVVLWASGFSLASAGGTSIIVAILVTAFVRHYIHWPLPKEAFAREAHLPPNVRPSDSSGREVVETVVFVVVLVLLLKSFAAEAFVIPTGSMAETLYGYNKGVKCPSCGITFPINCSNEVDPQDDSKPVPVNGCTCPNCRRVIRLVDPKREGRQPRSGVLQQDGMEFMEAADSGWSSGDRVLVGKFFDLATGWRQPRRLDVVVFKYPEGPQKNHVAMNYIKRLIGLSGETIAIWGGDLYVLSPEKSPSYDDSTWFKLTDKSLLSLQDAGVPEGVLSKLKDVKDQKFLGRESLLKKLANILDRDEPARFRDLVVNHADQRPVNPKERWQKEFMHANDERAKALFERGAFEIIRKPPEVLLAMRRQVYDNDHQASDLTGVKWQRWRPDGDAWEAEDDGKAFRHGTRVGEEKEHWLRYRHLLRHHHGTPTLITDAMGYNSNDTFQWNRDLGHWETVPTPYKGGDPNGGNWVGDLILECEVKIDKAEGELILELFRGPDRFRAKWDLASDNGLCTLTRKARGENAEEVLDRQPSRLKKGTYRLRFANVDRRLTVWVDSELPFGDGIAYDPPKLVGPTEADLQPASIGVRNGGALTVRKLTLWRDTYHTVAPNKVSDHTDGPDVRVRDWGDPAEWKGLREPPVLTLYVQPGHYLCLGDNSPQSSDGRTWGLVPERLLLGRALLVYWPPSRGGRIR
ncbi:MAG: hypothetical protein HYS12_26725 [Planctomycetes bacterium]|nr:hypothetical protein [Planctomycetota bacterium]